MLPANEPGSSIMPGSFTGSDAPSSLYKWLEVFFSDFNENFCGFSIKIQINMSTFLNGKNISEIIKIFTKIFYFIIFLYISKIFIFAVLI